MQSIGGFLASVERDCCGLLASAREKATAEGRTFGVDCSKPLPWPGTWTEEHAVVEPVGLVLVAHKPDQFALCPRCSGLGLVDDIEIRHGVEYLYPVSCSVCSGLQTRIDAFNRALLPVDLVRTRQSNTAGLSGELVAQVRGFATMRPLDAGMVLTGATGTGKTHLAGVTARRATLRGAVSTRWIHWPTWVGMLLASPRESDARRACTDLVHVPHLLVVDELGGGSQREFLAEIFEEMVGVRLERGQTTILTSNLAPEGIRDRFGDRSWSRIRRVCKHYALTGADRRGVV